jgi:hypothetical protein
MSDEQQITANQLMSVRPLTYLRGMGCLDETGAPREDLAGVLASAASRQFEAAEVSPQELSTLVEAIKQCLPMQDEGSPVQCFHQGVDHAMNITAELLNKEIHPSLYDWVMEWMPFMESPACIPAFIGHMQSVLAVYGMALIIKSRA